MMGHVTECEACGVQISGDPDVELPKRCSCCLPPKRAHFASDSRSSGRRMRMWIGARSGEPTNEIRRDLARDALRAHLEQGAPDDAARARIVEELRRLAIMYLGRARDIEASKADDGASWARSMSLLMDAEADAWLASDAYARRTVALERELARLEALCHGPIAEGARRLNGSEDQ